MKKEKMTLKLDSCFLNRRDPGEKYFDKGLDNLFKSNESISWNSILSSNTSPESKIWLATRRSALPLKIQKRFTDITVDRAVKKHCLNCGIKNVEAWASRWLDGSDRSCTAAYAAYGITSDGIIADVAYSAYVSSVTGVICTVSIATDADEMKLQISDLRRLITE